MPTWILGILNPAAWFKLLGAILKGDDHKKMIRITLLILLGVSVGMNGVLLYQGHERAKWYKSRGLPPPAPAATK